MADVKISGLPASTTPLAGTEVLPIVQSGVTKQVAVSDLTSGRSVSATSFTPSGATVPANGVYLPSANTLGFATNSTGAVWVDSAQKVGVGTSTPATTFQINGAIANTGGVSSSSFSGAAAVVNASASSATAGTHGSSLVFAQSWASGTPSSVIATGQITGVKTANDGSFGGGLAFWTSNGGGTDLAERMRLNSAGDVTVNTGNIVIGTAAKGIDFSANTGTAGMTSELLNWYEEGNWTPVDGSGAGLSITVVSAKYTRVGNIVTVQVKVTYPATASAAGAAIGGLPFTPATECAGAYYSGVAAGPTYYVAGVMYFATAAGAAVSNVTLSGQSVIYNMTYAV
jgi:hypothetical protein